MKSTQIAQTGKPKAPVWLQYLGVAAAGIATFAAAYYFNSSSNSAEVLPRAPNTKRTNTAQLAPAQDAPVDPSPSGMIATVVQDPFGPLNLAADVNPPPHIAANDPSRARKSKKPKTDTNPIVQPPPMVVAVAPPVAPPPQAPALPFKAIGTAQGPLIANGQQVVFLKGADYLITAHVGDQIDKTYRVEKITDTQVDLLYLPLKKLQSLAIAP